MHTGGEPLRVIIDGYPEIKGNNILEKRRYCMNHLDHIRKFLINEPRGHRDMYGCLVVDPNDDGAHLGVIFMHNAGYSTMCGHATIAIAKLALQQGWVEKNENGETEVRIDAPCGRLIAWVNQDLSVRFHNVPSFMISQDNEIEVEGVGNVKYDIAFGGAYYAYINVSQFDLEITKENVPDFITLGRKIKKKIASSVDIVHPFEADLSFLYGCIFIGPSKKAGIHSQNICIFADGEVDRCPTGSGVSGRIAIHIDKGECNVGEELTIESVIGSQFTVKAIHEEDFGPFRAYIPEVQGRAYIIGENTFLLEEGDPYTEGFLI